MEVPFMFPGFTLESAEENDYCYTVNGSVVYDDVVYNLTLLRIKNVGNGHHVVNTVTSGDCVVWDHKRAGFPGIAILVMTEDGPVVALCKGRAVQRIVPFVHRMEHCDVINASDLKHEVAEILGYSVWLSDEARRALAYDEEISRLSKLEEKRLAYAAEEEVRHAAQSRILRRRYISVTLGDGYRERGIPVDESEWRHIPPYTTAILVDDVKRPHGTAREVFRVVIGTDDIPEREDVRKVVLFHSPP